MEDFLGIVEESFSELKDYRREEGQRHPLINLIVISVCAIIANADSEQDIAEYAAAKKAWLETFLVMNHGTPSVSTIKRFFEFIDPEQFANCFSNFVKKIPIKKLGKHIALDGKTLRSSYDEVKGVVSTHIVNAMETELGLTLAQVKTETKSNEITAIPRIIDLINIEKVLVTIDAMGCQKAIAELIRKRDGDYLLALKSNHPKLHEEVINLFDKLKEKDLQEEYRSKRTVDKGHGRIEEREYFTISAEKLSLNERRQWSSIKSVVCTTTKRQEISTGKVSIETRYFISSLDFEEIDKISNSIRRHWGIENSLHYVLDMTFDEDASRIRAGNAAEVFSAARKLALNIS